jgi:hypothetical protein
MTEEVAEQITIAAPTADVYAAVADLRRMPKWSPECVAVWVTARDGDHPKRFIGWNRRGLFIWFTTGRVAIAEPHREFAFDVFAFGQPVARWGYRFAVIDGGTTVTEYWHDRRNRAAMVLGRIFTGKVATFRPAANRHGMQQTLARLKADLDR